MFQDSFLGEKSSLGSFLAYMADNNTNQANAPLPTWFEMFFKLQSFGKFGAQDANGCLHKSQ